MSSYRFSVSESGRKLCVERHFLTSVTNLPPHFNGIALKSPKKCIFCSVRSQCVQFLVSRWLFPCILEPPLSGTSVSSLQPGEGSPGGGVWKVHRFWAALMWKRHITSAYLPLVTCPNLDARNSGNCT